MPRPAAPASSGAAGGAFGLWRDPALRQMFLVSGIVVSALELFTFYMPIYGHAIGLSATAIGTVLAGYAIAAFVVRIFLPRLSRSAGEARVLTGAILMSGLIFLLFPFFRDPWVLALVAFVLGLGLGCCQPLAITLTYNCSPAGRIGEVLGMRISVNKLSEFICPLLFGSIGTAFGVTPVFATIALLLGGGAWLNRRKDGS